LPRGPTRQEPPAGVAEAGRIVSVIISGIISGIISACVLIGGISRSYAAP